MTLKKDEYPPSYKYLPLNLRKKHWELLMPYSDKKTIKGSN
jgi:hypothetical protein